jgi:phosphatidylethanolamine/phosphatidyl-N-methylethanolamine N-methyltransferase
MSERSTDVDHFYTTSYVAQMDRGIMGAMTRLAHRSLESPFGRDKHFGKTLELGAGNGQHFRWVRHTFDTYIETDIRAENLPSRGVAGHSLMALDATNLGDFSSESIDRIIATCLLTHVGNPEEALLEWKRVLSPGGVASIYLPADPGFLLRLSQHVIAAPKAHRSGLDYWNIHHREHPYHFEYLRQVLGHVFGRNNITIKGFPLPGFGWNLNLWFVAQARNGDKN